MNEIIREYFDSLCFYGYSREEAEKIYSALEIKYGNLSENEFKEVLYNAMISCNEEDLNINERLIHIDGLWYAARKYAKYRSKIKNLSLDDLVEVMENELELEQGDFLTEEEKNLMKIGIITNCIYIEEVERGNQKRL